MFAFEFEFEFDKASQIKRLKNFHFLFNLISFQLLRDFVLSGRGELNSNFFTIKQIASMTTSIQLNSQSPISIWINFIPRKIRYRIAHSDMDYGRTCWTFLLKSLARVNAALTSIDVSIHSFLRRQSFFVQFDNLIRFYWYSI